MFCIIVIIYKFASYRLCNVFKINRKEKDVIEIGPGKKKATVLLSENCPPLLGLAGHELTHNPDLNFIQLDVDD